MTFLRTLRQRWFNSSLLSMYVLLAIVVTLALHFEGVDGLMEGLEGSGSLSRRALPFFLVGIGLAGMVQVLAPPSVVAKWMGDEAGMAGLAVGMSAGALMPGGPYIAYPIAASLMSSGAGIGPMAGFMASRNVIAANRLFVWDIPFLGGPLAFARIISTLAMPPISVVLVPIVYRMMPRSMKRAPARTPVVLEKGGAE